MAKYTETNGRKSSYTGLGIALGAAIGLTCGLLFLDGNIGYGVGAGVALGLVAGSITDTLGRRPVTLLAAIALGAGGGILLGLLLGLVHGAYALAAGQGQAGSIFGLPFKGDYTGLGLFIGAGLGLVAGAILEVRKDRI